MSSWQDAYATRLPLYERLEEEVLFALRTDLAKARVKLHSLTSRVKALDSLTEKAERKQWRDPLADAGDIVGARVVVLFTSDLPRVQSIVTSLFDVFSTEDKVESADDPATFGYMSLHYGATISSAHSGPRYDELRDLRFEIQTRTILMDAWANVSHHLAYKDESSIPQELRRDFHALSGLFYVADKHFELFFGRSRQVERQASRQLSESDATALELNLETLSAFLRQRYPERKHLGRAAISSLVSDLHAFGYRDLPSLERMLDSARRLFARHERTQAQQVTYADVGVVRVSLRLTDPAYAKFLEHRNRRAAEAALRRSGKPPK